MTHSPDIMMGSSISYNFSLPFVFMEGTLNSTMYIQNIAQPVLLSFLKEENDVLCKQDNTCLQDSCATQYFL